MRIILDVDSPGHVFDVINQCDKDCTRLGQLLAGLLMTGKLSFAEAIGLAVYGVVHEEANE